MRASRGIKPEKSLFRQPAAAIILNMKALLMVFAAPAAALVSLSLSLSLSLSQFARGLAPLFKAAFKLPAGQAGFSLLGALAGAAIGVVVVMRTTQSFIQQKISLLALEKRIARMEVNRRGADGAQLFMGKAWDCKNTLKGKNLSGSSGDAQKSL